MDQPEDKNTLAEMRDLLTRILGKLGEHDQRFESIDQRFESIDQRFESIDQRFDAQDRKLDKLHLDLLNHEQDNDARLGALFDGQLLLTERIEQVQRRMDGLETGLGRTQRELLGLRRSVDQLQVIVGDHEHRLPCPP